MTQAKDHLMGDNPEEAQAAFGRTVLQRIAIVFKLATMHALNNEALVAPLDAVTDLVNGYLAGGESLALQLVGENVFLNQEVVKLDSGAFDSAQTLRVIFDRLGAQEIVFRTELEPGNLRDFLQRFQTFWVSQTPAALLQEKDPKIGLRALEQAQRDSLGAMIDERQNVLRAFAVVAVVLRESIERHQAGRRVQPVRLRRAIQSLAEAAAGHPSLVLGLARVPDLSGHPAFHHAAVVAYCLLMGRKLSLPRKRLMDLCMAAAMHELGLRPGEENEEGGRIALRTMLQVLEGRLGPDAFERAAVAVEIRHRVDGTLEEQPSILARLIAVPCAFDRLASPAAGRQAMPPDQALRIVLDNAGTRFDERVVRLFVSTVGLYPVGTLLRLSNGDEAVVLEVPEDPAAMTRPLVKVIRTAAGPTDHLLDLFTAGPQISIVETLDPVVEEINTASFLLA